jgi:hypothetical protein
MVEQSCGVVQQEGLLKLTFSDTMALAIVSVGR